MCHLWIERALLPWALQRGSPCKKGRFFYREGRVSSPFCPYNLRSISLGWCHLLEMLRSSALWKVGPFVKPPRSPLVPSPISW